MLLSLETLKPLDEYSHIAQSILDILRTPIGSMPTNREYGSNLYQYIDANIAKSNIAAIRYYATEALAKWEPRVLVKSIKIDTYLINSGHITLDMDVVYKPTNKLVTFKELRIT